jgi:glycosyltransferase involved in cell wall biosynthesis
VYASADVFVQTSRAEGSPLTVLEAAASGVPCMTTPAASLDGNISKHVAGLQVNATETDIARGFILCSSMQDSELRQMGQRGRELVAAHHSWTEKAQCLVDAYEGLLSRS